MKNAVATMALSSLLIAAPAFAEPSWLSGNIFDVTSFPGGLGVRLTTGVPDNCAGAAYGWMTIKETNKAMLALALTMWATGKTAVTVYTYPISAAEGCVIGQFDPAN